MNAQNETMDRIPHRLFVLRALRTLARGTPFVVLGAASWAMILYGVPFAPALFGYFLNHGWLEPLNLHGSLPGVTYFGLSIKGRGFLERGESWWGSLGFWQKLQVAVGG